MSREYETLDKFHILYSFIKPLACIKKWTFFGTGKSGFMIFHSQ